MILPYGAARGSPSRNLVRARTSRRPPARRCLRPASRPVSLPHAPTTEKDQFRSQDEGNRVARRRRPARRAAPTVRAQLRHGHAMSSRPPASIPPRGTAKADAPARLSLYDSLSVGVAPAASPPPHSPACARPLPSKRAQQRQPAHRDCNVRAGACAWRYRKSTPFLTESSVEGRTGEPRRLSVRGAGLSNSLRVRSRRAHPAAT